MLIVKISHQLSYGINISIHLMLMLIANQDEVTSISNKHFNTSHVNVNQSCWVSIGPLNFISIHLMLMLIADKQFLLPFTWSFQYISC